MSKVAYTSPNQTHSCRMCCSCFHSQWTMKHLISCHYFLLGVCLVDTKSLRNNSTSNGAILTALVFLQFSVVILV